MGGTGRKVLAVTVVVGLLALFMIACNTGPSYQIDEANKYIGKANDYVENYNKINGEMDTIWNKINAQPDTPEGFGAAVPQLEEIKTKLGEQKAEMEKAVEEYDAALKLTLSPDHKTYIGLLKDSANKQIEANAYNVQIVDEVTTMAASIANGTGTLDTVSATEKTVADLTAQSDKLEQAATDLKAQADKLYKDKNLGSKS